MRQFLDYHRRPAAGHAHPSRRQRTGVAPVPARGSGSGAGHRKRPAASPSSSLRARTRPTRSRPRACSSAGGCGRFTYLYSPADIATLQAAAGRLRGPLRAGTYTTLIALLAVTGLRIGEALAARRRRHRHRGGHADRPPGQGAELPPGPRSTRQPSPRYARLPAHAATRRSPGGPRPAVLAIPHRGPASPATPSARPFTPPGRRGRASGPGPGVCQPDHPRC